MKYVYVLLDNTLDCRPPDIFSTKEKALKELKKKFNEILKSSVYLTDEQKKKYKKQFKERKDWFIIQDKPDNPNERQNVLPVTRICSVTKEYIK